MTTTFETGCYIAGHRGQYAVSDLVRMVLALDIADYTAAEIEALYAYESGDATEYQFECVVFLADEAEAVLNTHHCEPDHLWGWYEGEFLYWPESSWEELA